MASYQYGQAGVPQGQQNYSQQGQTPVYGANQTQQGAVQYQGQGQQPQQQIQQQQQQQQQQQAAYATQYQQQQHPPPSAQQANYAQPQPAQTYNQNAYAAKPVAGQWQGVAQQPIQQVQQQQQPQQVQQQWNNQQYAAQQQGGALAQAQRPQQWPQTVQQPQYAQTQNQQQLQQQQLLQYQQQQQIQQQAQQAAQQQLQQPVQQLQYQGQPGQQQLAQPVQQWIQPGQQPVAGYAAQQQPIAAATLPQSQAWQQPQQFLPQAAQPTPQQTLQQTQGFNQAQWNQQAATVPQNPAWSQPQVGGYQNANQTVPVQPQVQPGQWQPVQAAGHAQQSSQSPIPRPPSSHQSPANIHSPQPHPLPPQAARPPSVPVSFDSGYGHSTGTNASPRPASGVNALQPPPALQNAQVAQGFAQQQSYGIPPNQVPTHAQLQALAQAQVYGQHQAGIPYTPPATQTPGTASLYSEPAIANAGTPAPPEPSAAEPAIVPPSLSGQGQMSYQPSVTNPQPGVYVPAPPADIPAWSTSQQTGPSRFHYTPPIVDSSASHHSSRPGTVSPVRHSLPRPPTFSSSLGDDPLLDTMSAVDISPATHLAVKAAPSKPVIVDKNVNVSATFTGAFVPSEWELFGDDDFDIAEEEAELKRLAEERKARQNAVEMSAEPIYAPVKPPQEFVAELDSSHATPATFSMEASSVPAPVEQPPQLDQPMITPPVATEPIITATAEQPAAQAVVSEPYYIHNVHSKVIKSERTRSDTLASIDENHRLHRHDSVTSQGFAVVSEPAASVESFPVMTSFPVTSETDLHSTPHITAPTPIETQAPVKAFANTQNGGLSRAGSNVSAVSRTSNRSSQLDEWYRESLARYAKVVLEESSAKSDAERIDIFCRFVKSEHLIRCGRYGDFTLADSPGPRPIDSARNLSVTELAPVMEAAPTEQISPPIVSTPQPAQVDVYSEPIISSAQVEVSPDHVMTPLQVEQSHPINSPPAEVYSEPVMVAEPIMAMEPMMHAEPITSESVIVVEEERPSENPKTPTDTNNHQSVFLAYSPERGVDHHKTVIAYDSDAPSKQPELAAAVEHVIDEPMVVSEPVKHTTEPTGIYMASEPVYPTPDLEPRRESYSAYDPAEEGKRRESTHSVYDSAQLDKRRESLCGAYEPYVGANSDSAVTKVEPEAPAHDMAKESDKGLHLNTMTSVKEEGYVPFSPITNVQAQDAALTKELHTSIPGPEPETQTSSLQQYIPFSPVEQPENGYQPWNANAPAQHVDEPKNLEDEPHFPTNIDEPHFPKNIDDVSSHSEVKEDVYFHHIVEQKPQALEHEHADEPYIKTNEPSTNLQRLLPHEVANFKFTQNTDHISEILDTLPEDFKFIAEIVSTWEAKAKETRKEFDKQRRTRQEQQEDEEEHYNELFANKQITYADIQELEEGFKRAEARKTTEEAELEFESYVTEVTEVTEARIRGEISKLEDAQAQCLQMFPKATAGRAGIEKAGTSPTVRELAMLMWEMRKKIEVRHHELWEVSKQRNIRYKKMRMQPLYAANKVAAIKEMERDLEEAERSAAVDSASDWWGRSKKAWAAFEEFALPGMTQNVDYIEQLAEAIGSIKESLPASAEEIHDSQSVRQEMEKARTALRAAAENCSDLFKMIRAASFDVDAAAHDLRVTKLKMQAADADAIAAAEAEKVKADDATKAEFRTKLQAISGQYKAGDASAAAVLALVASPPSKGEEAVGQEAK